MLMRSDTQRTEKRLLRESVWVVGGRLFGIATAIGVNVILARVTTPADFGLYFVLASVLTFASLVAMFGLNTGLVRFVSESIGRQDIHGVKSVLKRGSLLAGLGLWAGSLLCWGTLHFFGERLFRVQPPGSVAGLLALSVTAWSVIQLAAALLRSFHDSRWSILLTGQFGGPLSNTLFISLIGGWYLWSTNVTLHQAILCSTLALWVIMPVSLWALVSIGARRLQELSSVAGNDTQPAPDSASTSWIVLLTVCGPLMFTQCLSYVTGQADIWIGGAQVAPEELALYGASRRLMLLIGIPMQLVNLTVIASIAELRAQNKLPELQRILRSAATMAAGAALVVALPILIFPAQMLAWLFGTYYAEGANVLRVLCIGQLIFVCVGAAELTLMMTGRQLTALIVNLLTSLAMFGVGVLLTRHWGIHGLAWAWSLVVGTQCIAFCICARLRSGVWTLMDIKMLLRLPLRAVQ